MKFSAIALALSVGLDGPAFAAPGDPRLVYAMNVAPCDDCVWGRAANSVAIPPRALCRKQVDIDGKRHWCELPDPHDGPHVAYCGRQWSNRGSNRGVVAG